MLQLNEPPTRIYFNKSQKNSYNKYNKYDKSTMSEIMVDLLSLPKPVERKTNKAVFQLKL